MRDLKQITVIGMGLLGGSITLTVLRSLSRVKAVGYAHRPSTRRRAEQLAIATEIVGDIKQSVSNSGLVILATPVSTFEKIFAQIADSLPNGCIVTDVGSTKVLPHRWAKKKLPKTIHYVGSHPIAGSEQRGVEFARDDLFDNAACILTTTEGTSRVAVRTLREFWISLGCYVKIMTPPEHDKVFANVSHIPHILAASLINANNDELLKFAGKGFIDTSRIAAGPENIWADILLTNKNNITKGADKIIKELTKFKKAIKDSDKKQVEQLLKKARSKRAAMMNYKMRKKELLS